MSIKMLREHLSADHNKWQTECPSDISAAVDVVQMIDRHRPFDPNGKHGNRHTPTCGCEDK